MGRVANRVTSLFSLSFSFPRRGVPNSATPSPAAMSAPSQLKLWPGVDSNFFARLRSAQVREAGELKTLSVHPAYKTSCTRHGTGNLMVSNSLDRHNPTKGLLLQEVEEMAAKRG